MNTRVLLLGCLLAVAGLAQSATKSEIWEWTDANNVRHFSDSPVPGARKIVLVGDTTRSTPPPAPSAAAATRPAAPAATRYNSLNVQLPENGASFFGTDAVVKVQIESNPAVAQNDRLLTFVDGRMIEPANAYEHEISNLDRGAHSVMAVIADSRGGEIIRSQSRTFYIKQNSTVANPSNQGPSVRPPTPTPRPATPR